MPMNIKYQIFISSTYNDLRKEREQVIKATLEMGHIPVGMEMFSAADEEQWKLIQRQIDECDYYAVLLAHRYGSTTGEISYTEKEYDYAVSKGIPVIGFIIEDDAEWPSNKQDKDPGAVNKIQKFKDKVKQKIVSRWKNSEDLYGKYAIALMKLITSNPRPGWARASEIAGADVMQELSRLSSENAELRLSLNDALAKVNDEEIATENEIIDILQKNKITLTIKYEHDPQWTQGPQISLFELFFLLAPEMMIEKSTEESAQFTAKMNNPAEDKRVSNYWPIPRNYMRTWIADLISLGLIEPSTQKHSVKDANEYWTLTNLGRKIYTTIRRNRLASGISSKIEPDTDENEET